MEKDVLGIIRYFAQFGYPPNFDEVYTFFPKQISKATLQTQLDHLIQQHKLISHTPPQYISQSNLYTIPQYSMHIQTRIDRFKHSQQKRKKVENYINTLARFPSVQMIGISGSVAMMNAREEDDIDLFIITTENQIWTGRLTALLLAQWHGIRRKRTDWKHVTDKVCLNLFFDKKDMVIPTYKRTYYVGHEILQFKPVVNKYRTYEAFLAKNDWVFEMFPNGRKQKKGDRRQETEGGKLETQNSKYEGEKESGDRSQEREEKLPITNYELREGDRRDALYASQDKATSSSGFVDALHEAHGKDNVDHAIDSQSHHRASGSATLTGLAPAQNKAMSATSRLHPASYLESLAKSIQLPRIRAHQTNEIITETQLWFFPDDYAEVVGFEPT